MSGTSLDGLDMAYCEFEKKKHWKYKIVYAETKPYKIEWAKKLKKAFQMNKNELKKVNGGYGKFIGSEILKFVKRKSISPDFVSSHGHTVFHQPDKKITLQIGDGNIISSICKLPVVCDFRLGDVMLGGQGAPLVPIADKLLFSEYGFCLNLGGFGNISFDNSKRERIAFDICPVNIVLNALAKRLGNEFDKGGKIASRGRIEEKLLKKLNTLAFYKISPPKSLGREWVEKFFYPILNASTSSIQDKLRTVAEHIALQIAHVVNLNSGIDRPVLLTGGGAYNQFLIERISAHAKCQVILPNDKIIQFKEAMVFAFLGVLKIRREINILKSVTGATRNSSGGRIYQPS